MLGIVNLPKLGVKIYTITLLSVGNLFLQKIKYNFTSCLTGLSDMALVDSAHPFVFYCTEVFFSCRFPRLVGLDAGTTWLQLLLVYLTIPCTTITIMTTATTATTTATATITTQRKLTRHPNDPQAIQV